MFNARIRKIDATSGLVSTVAGGKLPVHPVFDWNFRYDKKLFAAQVDRPLGVAIAEGKPGKVLRDLAYAAPADRRRKMDVYLPGEAGEKPDLRPIVLLVHSRADEEYAPKDWGSFKSWGTFLAANGFVAAVFTNRFGLVGIEDASADVADALAFIRKNGSKWQVDPNRIGVITFSGASVLISPLLRKNPPQAIVSFYPLMDIRSDEIFVMGRSPDNQDRFSPILQLDQGTNRPSWLLIRAGKQPNLFLNTIDEFVTRAKALKRPIQVLDLPDAEAGFEYIAGEDAKTAVDRTLHFLQEHLTP